MVFARHANGTICGSVYKFTAKWTKCTITVFVVFVFVLCLVGNELTGWTPLAGCGRSGAAVLVFARQANGTICGLVSVLAAKGAKFAGNMFSVESVVVDDKFPNLAKIAGNVEIQVRLVLVVTRRTNLAV